MVRTIAIWAGIALAGGVCVEAAPQTPAQSAAQAPPATPAAQYRATLNRYCVTCHNDKLKTAGLSLEKLDVANVPAGAELWEKVIRKLRGNAMPPPAAPRPDPSFYKDFPAYLESSIDQYSFAHPNPGRPAVHRLNRAEYVNSVRDLLALDVDGATLLPSDDSGYGFDNIGDVLSISPTLLERYMSAARKVSRLAVGDPTMRTAGETFRVPLNLAQRGRMSEDLPFGSRGGIAVHYQFPADGEYVVKITLARDMGVANNPGDGGTIRGVALKRQLDVRLDDERIKLFTVGGEHFPKGGPSEEYEQHGADANLEVRFTAKAGPRILGVSFRADDATETEGVIDKHGETAVPMIIGRNAEPAVDTVTIRGPYDPRGLGDTPSRRKIFVCRPTGGDKSGTAIKKIALTSSSADEGCATKIISTLAHRAYRRPVTPADMKRLMAFYRQGYAEAGFEGGIRMAVQRVLGGPEFLFRVEQEPTNLPPGTPFHISDLELASRLSFFLWSSVPDDELLSLAEAGKLKDPAVLEQQVRRLLSDSRSHAFVSNFFGQWLQLRHLAVMAPDPSEFPEWDENLRESLARETELFLDSMVREDRPLMNLLDANYTYLNERLAKHYGISGIYGPRFRRVNIADERRKGLLGQGSILSLTSYPTRTSVVVRGVWLLENILATPPPAPPPNVPGLQDRGADGKIRSVRESMEAHRANPVCASCHLRMDPLGFALENFNAVGKWRSTEGSTGTPIDVSGKLPDGTTFNGPIELRRVLLSRPEQFATTVTEKLLTYAVGRGVEYYDEPVVRKIRHETAPDFRWSSLILGVVKSEPFQMRRTREQ